jgi:hypothetical protein
VTRGRADAAVPTRPRWPRDPLGARRTEKSVRDREDRRVGAGGGAGEAVPAVPHPPRSRESVTVMRVGAESVDRRLVGLIVVAAPAPWRPSGSRESRWGSPSASSVAWRPATRPPLRSRQSSVRADARGGAGRDSETFGAAPAGAQPMHPPRRCRAAGRGRGRRWPPGRVDRGGRTYACGGVFMSSGSRESRWDSPSASSVAWRPATRPPV